MLGRYLCLFCLHTHIYTCCYKLMVMCTRGPKSPGITLNEFNPDLVYFLFRL